MAAQQAQMGLENASRSSQAQANALNTQNSMMTVPKNNITTNGETLQVSNNGGGGFSGGSSANRSSGGGGSYGVPEPVKTPQQQAFELAQAFSQMRSNIPPQVAAPANIPPPTPPQMAGPSGAFSQAKDASGRTGSAAIKALHDLMTRRGMSDSGLESSGEAQILSGVQQQQAGAEYDAANLDASRQWEGQKLGYQGNLGQSSQGYQGAINQRGQDMDSILQLLSRIRF
jgi:hypothetical protein